MHSIENIQKRHENELWLMLKQMNEAKDRIKCLENAELLRQQREQETAKVLWELDYCHQKKCTDHHEKVYNL